MSEHLQVHPDYPPTGLAVARNLQETLEHNAERSETKSVTIDVSGGTFYFDGQEEHIATTKERLSSRLHVYGTFTIDEQPPRQAILTFSVTDAPFAESATIQPLPQGS